MGKKNNFENYVNMPVPLEVTLLGRSELARKGMKILWVPHFFLV